MDEHEFQLASLFIAWKWWRGLEQEFLQEFLRSLLFAHLCTNGYIDKVGFLDS